MKKILSHLLILLNPILAYGECGPMTDPICFFWGLAIFFIGLTPVWIFCALVYTILRNKLHIILQRPWVYLVVSLGLTAILFESCALLQWCEPIILVLFSPVYFFIIYFIIYKLQK